MNNVAIPKGFRSCMCFFIAILLLCGASIVSADDNKREGHVIKAVPFYPQEKHQCGPAALAGVLNYYGERLAPSEIAREIFDPKRKGTLNLDLMVYSKKKGYQVRPILGSVENLKYYISLDFPVIVYIRAPAKHFAVAVGYDKDGDMVLNSGTKELKTVPLKLFDREWKVTGRWALVIVPQDRSLPKMVDEIVKEGMELEKVGKYTEAAEAYDLALTRDPENMVALTGRGNSFLWLKEYEKALTAFEAALDVAPKKPGILNNMAWVEMELGDLKGALKHAKKAEKYSRKKTKNRHYYLDTLGTIYMKLGKNKKAAETLQSAIDEAPEDAVNFKAEVRKKLEEIENP